MAKNENLDEPMVSKVSAVSNEAKISTRGFIFILLVAVAAAIVGGYFFTTSHKSTSSTTKDGKSSGGNAGIMDKKKFPDHAEGILQEGGVDGEGNFHLERPGGESQNVYLTSAIVDLSSFVGKKIRVWGQTNKAQKAGWLMDVGYVENL